MLDALRIGILGLGTVGGGTLEILQKNAGLLTARCGKKLEVTRIATRTVRPDPETYSTQNITIDTQLTALVEDPNIDVVVELIGGTTLAKELVLAALKNKKHVVTANKALIAEHGTALHQLAADNQVALKYEASVAGGVPILKGLSEGLAANQIHSVAGIINGTCNFILSAMAEQKRAFDDVLTEAQALGYAEADPTFDVEGIDAAHKLTILASLAFGMPLQFDKISTEGITAITCEDLQFADELGFKIKHLGVAAHTIHGVDLHVAPTLIPKDVLLAHVDGVMNAVMINGSPIGQTLFYGAGAGAGPTGSAVVADLVDLAKNPEVCSADVTDDLPLLALSQTRSAFYLRLTALNKAGTLAKVSDVLSHAGINVKAILQHNVTYEDGRVPLVILTQETLTQTMHDALEKIASLDVIDPQTTCLRVDFLGNNNE